MKTLSDLKNDATDKQADQIIVAERDLQRIQDEIRPFIRKRPVCEETSIGKWMESSSFIFLET